MEILWLIAIGVIAYLIGSVSSAIIVAVSYTHLTLPTIA